jgi:phytoene synthase
LRWLWDAGLDPEKFLANPVMSAALKSVVARLLNEADKLYDRAKRGIACLPPSCRPAILSAAILYAEIGRKLENLSYDSIAHRARVSGPRKAQLLAQALFMTPYLKDEASIPPLNAVRFLIEAVAASPLPVQAPAPSVSHHLKPQFLRVLAIFERLERGEEKCEAVFPRH